MKWSVVGFWSWLCVVALLCVYVVVHDRDLEARLSEAWLDEKGQMTAFVGQKACGQESILYDGNVLLYDYLRQVYRLEGVCIVAFREDAFGCRLFDYTQQCDFLWNGLYWSLNNQSLLPHCRDVHFDLAGCGKL